MSHFEGNTEPEKTSFQLTPLLEEGMSQVMRISQFFFLLLVSSPFWPSSHPAYASRPRELARIEAHLDAVLTQDLSPRKARDFKYQTLARVKEWVLSSGVPLETIPYLNRVISKILSLSRRTGSPWDESFFNLMQETYFDERDPPSYQVRSKRRIVEAINELFSQIKAEELFQIKGTLENSRTEASPNPPAQALVRIASWLSSLKPARELTAPERELVIEIVSKCKNQPEYSDPEWQEALSKLILQADPPWSIWSLISNWTLRSPLLSDSLESSIHKTLATGPKLTKSLKNLKDARLREKILDLFPEDEARSLAQINRDWRAMIYEYQKKKKYPPSFLPPNRELFRQKLEKASLLSEEEMEVALRESDFHGFGEHRAFLYSIYLMFLIQKLSLTVAPPPPPDVLQNWTEELKRLVPRFPEDSLLSQLSRELTTPTSPGEFKLSESGKQVLRVYQDLAKKGNVYAQQTVHWIGEIDSLRDLEGGNKERLLPIEEQSSLATQEFEAKEVDSTDYILPESFPDYRLYVEWKKAIGDIFQIVSRGDYGRFMSRGDYTQGVFLHRLYQQRFFRFADPVLLSKIGWCYGANAAERSLYSYYDADEFLMAETSLPTLREQALFYQYLRRNMERWKLPVRVDEPRPERYRPFSFIDGLPNKLLLREASLYAALGDPERARSILEPRLRRLEALKNQADRLQEAEIKDLKSAIVIYDLLLASDSSSRLLEGKDEMIQMQILNHLKPALGEKELMSVLRETPYPSAGDLLKNMRTSPNTELDKRIREIEILYWIGAAKDKVTRQNNEVTDDREENMELSLLDSILTSSSSQSLSETTEAQETKEARELLQEMIEERGGNFPEPSELIRMLARRGKLVDANHWIMTENILILQDRLSYAEAFFERKDFKTALVCFENFESYPDHFQAICADNTSHLWFTRYAQACLETGGYENTLRILAIKGENLNFVDHELRVQALTHLGEEAALQAAVLSKESHERLVLLPDLRKAARLYEEDGDLVRARQVLLKLYEISKRLDDENAVSDQRELERVTLK